MTSLFKAKPPDRFISDLKIVASLPWEKVDAVASEFRNVESFYEFPETREQLTRKLGLTQEQVESARRVVTLLWAKALDSDFSVSDLLRELTEYGLPKEKENEWKGLLEVLSSEDSRKKRRRVIANTAFLHRVNIPVITDVDAVLDSRIIRLKDPVADNWALPVIILTFRHETKYQQEPKEAISFQLTIGELRSLARILNETLDEFASTRKT